MSHLPGEETRVLSCEWAPLPCQPWAASIDTRSLSRVASKGSKGARAGDALVLGRLALPRTYATRQPCELPSWYCCQDTSSHPCSDLLQVWGLSQCSPDLILDACYTHTDAHTHSSNRKQRRTQRTENLSLFSSLSPLRKPPP